VFRVWDLTTYKCLQIFSDTENRPGERRVYCMHFDQKRDRLLTCSSVLDCWPLTRSIQDNLQPPRSHDRPILALGYSNNQMASICAESTLKVWEADTGLLVYTLRES
jgi:WD40 repeat protein